MKNKLIQKKRLEFFFFFQGTKAYLEKQMRECESHFKEKLTTGTGGGGKKSRS